MRHLAFFAACEATLGVALWIRPSLVLRLLFGAEASGTALVLGRFAGIALLSLALACWPARDTSARRPAERAALLYNALATLFLLYLGIGTEWVGPLLWPAAMLHAAITAACLVALRRRTGPAE